MRIGIGAQIGPLGGPATYARELTAGLARARGHEYVVFTDRPEAFAGLDIEAVAVPLPNAIPPAHLGPRPLARLAGRAPRRSVPRDQERAALAAVDACGGHSARCRGLYLRRDLLVAAAPAPSWANAA